MRLGPSNLCRNGTTDCELTPFARSQFRDTELKSAGHGENWHGIGFLLKQIRAIFS